MGKINNNKISKLKIPIFVVILLLSLGTPNLVAGASYTIRNGSVSPTAPTTADSVSFDADGDGTSVPSSMYVHYRRGTGAWVHLSMSIGFFELGTGYFIWDGSVTVGRLSFGSYEYYFTPDASGSSTPRYPGLSNRAFSVTDGIAPTIFNIGRSPINPDNTNSVTVTASVTDSHSSISSVTLQYSTNGGSTWSNIAMSFTSGAVYTGTIPARSYGTTVNYRIVAIESAGNSATSPSSSYTIRDGVNPTFSQVNRNIVTPDNTQSVSVSATVSDADSGIDFVTLYYRVNSGGFSSVAMASILEFLYRASIPARNPNDFVEYYVRAVDNQGNAAESIMYSYTVTDGIAPVISNIIQSPLNPDNTDFVRITADVSDVHSSISSVTLQFSTNEGSTWTNIIMSKGSGNTYTGFIPPPSFGVSVSYKILAVDSAGNSVTSTTYSYIIMDGANPVISQVNRNPVTPLNTQSVSISATVTDVHSGVDSVTLYFRVNFAEWATIPMVSILDTFYRAEIQARNPNDLVEYYVLAVDNQGNSVVSNIYSYTVADGIDPIISNILINPTIPDNTDLVSVTADVTDTHSSVSSVTLQYSINSGSTWSTVIMSSTGGAGYSGTIPTHSFGVTVYYRIVATDSAGNTATSTSNSYTVRDGINPFISQISRTPTTPDNTQSVSVSATVTDAHSGVNSATLYFRINGGTWTSIPMTSILESIYTASIPARSPNDLVEYYLRAVDNQVNSVISITYSYTVSDTIDPVISNTVLTPINPDNTNSVTVKADVTDTHSSISSVTLQYTTNGGSTWSDVFMNLLAGGDTYSGSIPIQSYSTTVSYRITAIDDAGNSVTSPPSSYTVRDGVNPLISQVIRNPLDPDSTQSVSTSATVTDADSGINSVTLYYRINAGTWVTVSMTSILESIYTGSIPDRSSNDLVEYYVRAVDNHGNIADSIIYSYTVVDSIAPVISNIILSPANPDNTALAVISADVTDADSGINSVTLQYSTNGGSSWSDIIMTLVSSNTYSGSVPIQSYDVTVIYRIIVTDSAGNSATSATLSFTVRDGILPIISSVNRNPVNPDNTQSVTFEATVTDADSGINSVTLFYRINGGIWTSTNMNTVVESIYTLNTLSRSPNTFIEYYVRAVDNQGNTIDSIIYSYTVADGTAPVISNIVHSPLNPDNLNSVSVTADVVDAHSSIGSVTLQYSTNGGSTWTNIAMTPVSFTEFTGDIPLLSYSITVTYRIIATDSSGNSVTSPLSSYTVVDGINPVISSVTRNPLNPDNTQGVAFEATVTDADSGINSVTLFYRVNGGFWVSADMTSIVESIYTLSILARSPNDFVEYYVRAVDNHGNSVDSITYSYTVVDGTAPTISNIVHSPANPDNTIFVTITADVVDAHSSIGSVTLQYSTNGGSTWTDAIMTQVSFTSFTGDIPIFSYGTTVTYRIVAIDSVGNSVISSSSSYSVLDAVYPIISNVLQSPLIPDNGGSVSINADISDEDSGINSGTLFYRLDGGSWTSVTMILVFGDTYSSIIPVQSYNTNVEYYISGADNSGNSVSSAIYSYAVLDAVVPVIINISQSPAYPDNSAPVTISADISDADSGVSSVTLYYRVDGASRVSVIMILVSGSTYSATIPTQGYNANVEYYIEGVDNSGNTASSVSYSYIVIDGFNPIISNVAHSPAIPDNTGSVTVTADITDADSGINSVTLYYNVNGGSWIAITMIIASIDTYSATIPVQSYNTDVMYYINVLDNIGNSADTLGYIYTVIDAAVPVVSNIVQTPANPTSADSVTVTADVTDIDSGVNSVVLSYRLDDGFWTNVSMSSLSGSTYSGSIPAQVSNANVEYYIIVYDNAANFVESVIVSYTVSTDVTTTTDDSTDTDDDTTETDTDDGTYSTTTDDDSTDTTSSNTDPTPGFRLIFSLFILISVSIIIKRQHRK